MAGDKTEKATPKKRRDARKEGQIVKSSEVTNAVSLAAILAVIKAFSESTGLAMMNYVRTSLVITDISKMPSAEVFFSTFASILLPFVSVSLLAGVVMNYAQAGFLFSLKNAAPKFSRLNPLEGVKRLFSKKALFAGVKSVIKLSVIGAMGFQTARTVIMEVPQLMNEPLATGLHVLLNTVISIGTHVAVGLAIISVADYIFERLDHEKRLRMSKQEIKDEYKKTEGDPIIKSGIRSRQVKMARMRMMQSVPKADVVVVNPTHYAVAIQYEMKAGGAPMVVAKGVDRIALKIREIAAENGVHIAENKPLARALYAKVDIGEAIPVEYYRAVAEVLAYVYSMKNKVSQEG